MALKTRQFFFFFEEKTRQIIKDHKFQESQKKILDPVASGYGLTYELRQLTNVKTFEKIKLPFHDILTFNKLDRWVH